MKVVQLELDFEGLETFERSEELKEARKEINRSLARERTAERRLYGPRKLRRRKGKKKDSSESIPAITKGD